MISAKYQKIVFSLIMALFMSGIMSFVISVFNVGLIENIFTIWIKAWSFAFIAAFPTIMLISPIVQKIVSRLISTKN